MSTDTHTEDNADLGGSVKPEEIKLRRSLLNLGGEIQSDDIAEKTVHAIFDKVNEQGARLGEINYVGVYWFNDSADFPIRNPILYCAVNSTSPSDDIRFGWDPVGVNKEMQAITDEFTPPTGIAWNNGASRTTGSPLGQDIPPKGFAGCWFERAVNFNAQSFEKDKVEIDLDYDRTDRIIPEGFGIAVMGNMGCGSIFNDILKRVELRAPFAIVTTGGNSYLNDGRCWIQSITPLQKITKMAFGEDEWKSTSLINQYKNALGLSAQYYSFNFYNVHVLIVSTPEKFSIGSKQYKFIDEDLSAASKDPRIDWIIVSQQEPFWAAKDSSGRLPNSKFRDIYAPLYQKYGVHIVLHGKNYNYQRLSVVNSISAGPSGNLTSKIWYAIIENNNFQMMHTIAHEIIEAQSDPDVIGRFGKKSWKDYGTSPREELSDVCDQFTATYGSGLHVGGYWSNSDDKCVIPGATGSGDDASGDFNFTNPSSGPVLTSATIYLIFWGAGWKTQSGYSMEEIIDRTQNQLLGTNSGYFGKMSQYDSIVAPTWGGSIVNEVTPIPTHKDITDAEYQKAIRDCFEKGLLSFPADGNDDIYILCAPKGKTLFGGAAFGYHDAMKPTIKISPTTLPEVNLEDQQPNYSFEGKSFPKGFLDIIVGNTGGRVTSEDLDKVIEDPLPEFVKKTEWDKHGYLWLEWTNQGRRISGRLYDRKDNALDNFQIINNTPVGEGIPPPVPNPGPGKLTYTFSFKFGSNGSGNGQFLDPHDISFDAAGNLFVCDRLRNDVQKFTNSGTYISKFGGPGSGNGQFDVPYAIQHTPDYTSIYVCDRENNRVQKLGPTGTWISNITTANGKSFNRPEDITFDKSNGDMYICDTGNDRIVKLSATHTFILEWGTTGNGNGQFQHPHSINTDLNRRVYISCGDLPYIQKFTELGVFLKKWGTEGDGDGQTRMFLEHMDIDAFGRVHLINNDVRPIINVWDLEGRWITRYGKTTSGSADGQFKEPEHVTVYSDGRPYVVDAQNFRIQVFDVRIVQPPPGPGPGPTPNPIPIDGDGIQWMVARGKITKIKQSRDRPGDSRWSMNFKGIRKYGYEATIYFDFTGVTPVEGHVALKHWGANHTPPCGYQEGTCCCWYDTGIRANGDVQLEIERPHPHNEKVSASKFGGISMTNIGVPMEGNRIGLKWLIHAVKDDGDVDHGGVHLVMWKDSSGFSGGRPQNNWIKIYDVIDTGQILGDFPALSEQEIEVRNSDTDSRDDYGGVYVRQLQKGDATGGNPDPDPIPDPGPPTTTQDSFGIAGDWDANSDTDKTVTLVKNRKLGAMMAAGDLGYVDNDAGPWLSKVSSIDSKMHISFGNHEHAEGADPGLADDYRNHYGYSNFYHAETFKNVRMIALDSEITYTNPSSQYTFIKNEVESAHANPNIKWIIVYCHGPFYAPPNSHHNVSEYSPTLRSVYHALFSTNHVDLVVGAHNHMYNRSYPLQYNSGSQGSPIIADNKTTDYVNLAHPIFLTVGTAGRSRYETGDSVSYIIKRDNSFFGILVGDLSNNGLNLTMSMVKHGGSVFDTWTMRKT